MMRWLSSWWSSRAVSLAGAVGWNPGLPVDLPWLSSFAMVSATSSSSSGMLLMVA